MKRRKIVYFILMFFPLVATLVLLPFFPEQIPAHYGADHQVTRWGSKWGLLLFPAATLLMAGAAMAVVSLLTHGWCCFAWAMGILLIVTVVDVIYTYRVAKGN